MSRARRVKVLLHEERGPGAHDDVVWDGTDARGAGVPSGVYFYRFESGLYQEVRTMILVR